MSAQTERLKARLAAIPAAVKSAVLPALMKSGEELADRMKTLAPVRHGALRDSITVTPPGGTTPNGRHTARETQVFVTADAGHATYTEYGTHQHGGPEPFFWPAYRLSKKREISRIKRAISQAVKTQWAN